MTDDKHLRSPDDPALLDENVSAITPALSTHFPSNNRFWGGFPIGTGSRWLLIAGSLCLLAGFGMSALLSPDPRGYGTHQQFGFPPCTLLMFTGTPCPSCGGTTAFAHFVRGEWPSALRSNAAAFVLAIVCAAAIPWSWWSAARGRLIGINDYERALLVVVFTMTGLFTLQWAVRLLGG